MADIRSASVRLVCMKAGKEWLAGYQLSELSVSVALFLPEGSLFNSERSYSACSQLLRMAQFVRSYEICVQIDLDFLVLQAVVFI